MIKSLTSIPGLGPKTQEALNRLNINSLNDLLWHFPSNVIHKNLYPPIFSLNEGELVILRLRIIAIDQFSNARFSRNKPFKIYCENETGKLQLVFFNYHPQYLLNWAKIDSEIIAIGKIEVFIGYKQINHPEIINPLKPNFSIAKDEVVYPLTYGITNKQLQKYISFALNEMPPMEEWLDSQVLQNFGWDDFKISLEKLHSPKNIREIALDSKAKQRIAYDELLATQLMINILRYYKDQNEGRNILASGQLLQRFLDNLPFELTIGQLEAIKQISLDQNSGKKMSRLLQGDVGCGKTMVAFSAMLNVVESKAQAVLMAPTDVLANQLFLNLEKFFSNLPVKYALLTGKTKTKERQRILAGLALGEIDILVGTHAVFQEKVIFKDLALVVIDEQHRFGVNQRLSLLSKGNKADLLIMSATPIPRSLSLALYGDMEITKIMQKPKSRIPIKTSIIPKNKLNDLIASLDHIIQDGGKIYWVCPLIVEGEEAVANIESVKIAAETRKNVLEKFYPSIVGLIHGKLDNISKQESLDKFISSEYKILVATTVIEVGVDVADATVMIIENAESFGLSQLHQLRGRVGRGAKASNCILLYTPPISNTSWQRLKILKETEDGFLLAEEDLKLRGSGDIIGTKQSGLPDFKVVDLMLHHHFTILANEQAKKILAEDPLLQQEANQKYRHLLEVFGYNQKNSIIN